MTEVHSSQLPVVSENERKRAECLRICVDWQAEN